MLAVVGFGVAAVLLPFRGLAVALNSLAAAERSAADLAVRIVLDASVLLAGLAAVLPFDGPGCSAAAVFGADLAAGDFAAAAFAPAVFFGAASAGLAVGLAFAPSAVIALSRPPAPFLVAGDVALNSFAAAERSVGDLAVRIFFAASLLAAGALAAASRLAGALIAMGWAAIAWIADFFVLIISVPYMPRQQDQVPNDGGTTRFHEPRSPHQ